MCTPIRDSCSNQQNPTSLLWFRRRYWGPYWGLQSGEETYGYMIPAIFGVPKAQKAILWAFSGHHVYHL